MSDVWTREYVVEVKHADLIAGSPFSHPFREEIVRCRDCIYYAEDQEPIDPGWPMMCGRTGDDMVEPYGFCAWGERREEAEAITAWNTRHERTCHDVNELLAVAFECSECGFVASTSFGGFQYCPGCGAKVIGGGEHDE